MVLLAEASQRIITTMSRGIRAWSTNCHQRKILDTQWKIISQEYYREMLQLPKTSISSVPKKMADLPRDRVTPSKLPFAYIGVDWFGPFEMKRAEEDLPLSDTASFLLPHRSCDPHRSSLVLRHGIEGNEGTEERRNRRTRESGTREPGTREPGKCTRTPKYLRHSDNPTPLSII